MIPVQTALLATDGSLLAPERLLVLEGTEQSWTFDDIASEPVPSLLRGFSAPVNLADGLGDEDLLVLLAHDTDAFNRWEASQRLALTRLLEATDHGRTLDEAFIEAMRQLLRHPTLDPAFKALALSLPSEGYVAEQLPRFDPQRIHAGRQQLLDQLAERLQADWAWAFDAHAVREGYAPTPEQSGRRALANLALAMLCRHAVRQGDPVWPGRAYQRVKDGGNMTDRLGALTALVDAQSDLADEALARFHAAAGGDALVVDKWFRLQALAEEPVGAAAGRAFARARALLKHPDFTLKNPNRARSLIFEMCMFNPAAFHRVDAAGYVFWAERLLELDAINPQQAARLARVMDRWSSLVERTAARRARPSCVWPPSPT